MSLKGYVYHRTYKKKPGDPGTWPEKKKTEAVLTWLTTGNMVTTSSVIGVGLPTLKKWKQQPWWKEIVDQFQADDKQELDAKYQKIIRKALEVTSDRLENGNFQLDQKTGQILRVPVNISESHRVTMDLVNQQQALRKNQTIEAVQAETINDKLIKLASQFAEMALGKKEKVVENIPELLEGPEDAIYEEREAGLQEGERPLQQQANPEEAQSTEEQSEGNDGQSR